MKKYLPIFIFILVFAGFLGEQVGLGWFSGEKPAPLAKKVDLKNYETLFQNLTLSTIDNQQINLASLDSSIVILNFWASWCGPCLREFPSLVELRKKFPHDKVTILGISSDEENPLVEIERVSKKYAVNFPIVSDEKGDIFNQFEVNSIPFSLIYHRGKILEVNTGPKDFNSLETEETLREILVKDSVLMGKI